jgi:thiol-disulfide isomerase/thioredoxin
MGRVKRARSSTIAIGFVVLGAAIALAATRFSFLQGTPPSGSVRHDPAPEFAGIDGWLNSPPLTIASLRGKVVLVDFWTYSCINCVRTFPALRALYGRYHPAGFEIVGVHSPEFSFEKVAANVRDAVRRDDVIWPVALDNEMATWSAYANHYWPHVYLIDAKGSIRFDHVGEGGDDLIQARIRSLLTEAHATVPAAIDLAQPAVTQETTPEIYAGPDRGAIDGAIGNPEGYRSGTVDYKPVDRKTIAHAGTNGIFFLQGKWRASGEFLEAEADGARLELPFYARNVYFVADAPGGAEVRLLLDGKAIATGVAGRDAQDGIVRTGRSDLYSLVTSAAPATHRLTLVAQRGFRLYTFTFG